MSATATVEALDLTEFTLDQGHWAKCKVVYRSFFRGSDGEPCNREACAVVTVLCRNCGSTKIPICRLHLFMIRRLPHVRVGCRKCGQLASWSGGGSGDRV